MIKQKLKLMIIMIASIGGGLELYDFVIYIFFSPILAKLFFPKEDALAALLSVMAIFAVGYLARPLGAIIYGHLGDKFGRKRSLLYTLILMAVASTLTAFLPTYKVIGDWAPFFLVILRLLQGIAVGGDLPGAITFVAEHTADEQRAYACSWVYFGVNFGILVASAVATLLMTLLSKDQLALWGWRLAFLLGLVIAVVAYYLRKRLLETPYFHELTEQNALARVPALSVLKTQWRQILQGICLIWLLAAGIVQIFLYMPTYWHILHRMSLHMALLLNSISLLVFTCMIPLMGYLADKVGRKPLLIICSLLFMAFSYPLYSLLHYQSLWGVYLALLCFAILTSMIVGIGPAVLTELFKTKHRYTGIGLAYNISFAIFGGLTPYVLTYLLKKFPLHEAVSFNLIAAGFAALIAVIGMRDLTKQSLP